MYQWIMYLQQNIPGSVSFDLQRVASIAEAREHFETFRREVYSVDCTATLYAYSEEAWESAEEFRGVGCPFDYPDRLLRTTKNGGVRVERT